MLCGTIISYEIWGEKQNNFRTIINKLFSLTQIQCIRYIWVLNSCIVFRTLYGPISLTSAKIFFFVPKVWTGFCALFTLNEMIILRFMSIFVWKTIPPINENFFLAFLTMTNETLALLMAIFGVMGYNVEQDTNYILTGQRIAKNETPVFR